MSDKIQGEIKRGDAEYGSDRKPAKNAEMGISPRHPIERDNLAGNTLGLLRCYSECLDSPTDFPFGIGDRLSRLSRDQPGKLVASIIDRPGYPLQEMITSVRGKSPHRLGRVDRRLDSRLGVSLSGLRDLGQNFPREGVVHRSDPVTLSPLTPDEKWTWSLQGDAPLVEEVLQCGID